MSWPVMCVRCGNENKSQLVKQQYVWKQLLSQTQYQGYTKTQSAKLNVTTYICKNCYNIGKMRFIFSVAILSLLSLLSFLWTFGFFSDGPELLGLIILAPSIGFLTFHLLLRRKVSRFYAHFYHSSGRIMGFFRSKKYKEAFYSVFPNGIYVKKR
ncbi:MAG: hypothetical protein ACTSXD_09405 [Candidatus Heimdallarchaeaceae archaeon]